MITLAFNRTELNQAKDTIERWGKSKPKLREKLLEKIKAIPGTNAGKVNFEDSELVYLLKCGLTAGCLKLPPKHKPRGRRPKENPLANRTKTLRASGAIKATEWIGGNEFHQVKPAVNKFLEREKHGQLRMQLNPKKKLKARKKPAKKKKSLP